MSVVSSYATKIGLKPVNEILSRDDIGKSKVSTRDLPSEDFYYGKPLAHDPEGAREVSMTWKFHQKSEDKQPPRDLKTLNKHSLRNSLHTSKEFTRFRAYNDAFIPFKKGSNTVLKLIPFDEFTYGIPNRPSTPIQHVISNQYGETSEQRLKQIYNDRYLEYETVKSMKTLPKLNRASQMAASMTSQKIKDLFSKDEKPLFKLTKFKRVSSKVDCKARTWKYGEPLTKTGNDSSNHFSQKVN